MLAQLKNLLIQLKLFESQFRRRRRIYIVPSVSGALLFLIVTATYLVSFVDRNPWLTSLGFAGFIWFVFGIFLTTGKLANLKLSPDGRITNEDDEPATHIRVNGQDLKEIPAHSSVSLPIFPGASRFRISTFGPTGFFYGWIFLKPRKHLTSDMSESRRFTGGMPVVRIDWRLWFRRGRFLASPRDPQLRLRPTEESAPEVRPASRKNNRKLSDASSLAFLWSVLVLAAIFTTSLFFVPLWSGIIVFGIVTLFIPGFFLNEKYRYWGKINFFFCWITLALVIVAGKASLEPWMITTPILATLFIPFALYLQINGTDQLWKKFRGILTIVGITLFSLYSVKSIIAKRFQSRDYFYGRSNGNYGNDINWGATLSSDSLNTAEKFLIRGQSLFWVQYPREVQTLYRSRLPYWRESTYTKSRAGLNWFNKILAGDTATPVRVNSFFPGHAAPELQRESPVLLGQPTITAFDPPREKPPIVLSLAVRDLARQLRLNPEDPIGATRKVMTWLQANNFRYSLTPGHMIDMDDFLFRRKIGLCQHYAASVAYILRAGGISSRVVAGYQGGEVNPQNETLLMHDYDAHAWAEVWNPKGKAWFLVDPTATLFPNEYRNIPAHRSMDLLGRVLTALQSFWTNLDRARLKLILGLSGFFLSAGLFLCLGRGLQHRQIARRKALGNQQTIPMVLVWERKVYAEFGQKRKFSESLNGFFNRVIRKRPGASDSPLASELKGLVETIYRDGN